MSRSLKVNDIFNHFNIFSFYLFTAIIIWGLIIGFNFWVILPELVMLNQTFFCSMVNTTVAKRCWYNVFQIRTRINQNITSLPNFKFQWSSELDFCVCTYCYQSCRSLNHLETKVSFIKKYRHKWKIMRQSLTMKYVRGSRVRKKHTHSIYSNLAAILSCCNYDFKGKL